MLYRAELLPVVHLTDGVGFEPTRAFTPHDFQSCSLSLSDTRPSLESAGAHRVDARERRGWDSNPRTPFERDGLANRCRNHLATSPRHGRGGAVPRDPRCPSFVLPLLGSNQDSPDPESGVLPITPRGIAGKERETGLEPATLSLGS